MIDRMSLWEFNAATGGYLKAHTTEDPSVISDREATGLAELLDRSPVRH